MAPPYTNNFRGRANRQEKSKHLRDEFTRIAAAFSTLSATSQRGFNNMFTNSVPFLGALTIDPANGYLQEVTLTTTTTIMIQDPTGAGDTAQTKRVALVIHGSNKKVINGWGPQTWKEHGPNDWIIAYTGSGRYASMVIEFYWDGKAWMATIAGKNQNIDLVSDATQAIFPFTASLTDLDAAETLVLTRASPANVFDYLGGLIQRQSGAERYAGSRYVHNWVATPSDLQSVAWEAVNVTVATEAAAGPASENVDKLTFTTVGGEVGCWMLPHFGRNGPKADTIKIAVRFQAKMSAATTGSMRVVVALMGAQGGSPVVHETITVTLSNSWVKFGHAFDIVTSKDPDSFDLTNPNNQRTLVKLSFKSPSGALGDPVLVTNVQAEILRRGESTVPSEAQDGTIGSSITLAATGASTGAWNDGTKALTLDIGEFVDFQDSLDIGKTYLAVPVLSAGSSANVLMLKDQVFWRAYNEAGGDSKYVQDAPFTFRYEGGVFKFELQHGVSATYALNIYECSSQTGVFDVGKEEQVSSLHVMSSSLGDYVQAQLGDGLAHESVAIANLIGVGNYRNFDGWTKVNLTDAPDVDGVITSQQSEFGIDGYPMHGTAIQATNPLALGYLSLSTAILSNSSEYTFTLYVRKTFNNFGTRVVDAQQAQLATSSSASRYIGFNCLIGSAIGGDILVLDIAKASLGSTTGTDYSVLVTEIGDWIKVSISLTNSSQTTFEARVYPAIDAGGTSIAETGWAIIDWAQLEIETGDVRGSSPVVGGETRSPESFATALANGTLYDANANEIGDITSLVWTFDAEGEDKSVLWSTSAVVSTYGAKHLHEFGPAIPAVCVESLQDTLGSALLDTNNNGLCAETSNSLEPSLTGLEYYWDFEQLHYDLDASTDTGYWSIAPLLGFGTNWYTFIKLNNIGDPSALGLHSNNAASFPTTSISYRMALNDVEYSGDSVHSNIVISLLTTSESTIAFWLYVGGLSAVQTVLSCGDHDRNEGPHISINTNGTVEWAAGDGNTPFDHSLIEAVTSTKTVNASAWNLIVIKHKASTKTVGISINGVTYETGTYTRALASSSLSGVLLGCRFFNNNPTYDQPIVAGGRLNYLGIWGVELSQSIVDAIYNLGKGLDNTEFFGVDSYWPAGGWHNNINSKTQPPEMHLDISNSYSIYSTTAPKTSERVTANGVDVEYMLSSGIMNNGMDSGFSIPAKLRTSVQNSLNVLRFTGAESYDCTIVPPSHATLGSQFTFFFAGSVTSGVIFDIGSKNFPGSVGLADPHPYIEADIGGGLTFQDSVISVAMDAADLVGAGVFFIGAVQFVPSAAGPLTNGTVKLFLNGALKKTDFGTADDTYTEHTIEVTSVIGDRQSSTLPAHTQQFVGDIGELIFYKEALTDDQVRSVMNWMNSKWAAY